MDAHYHVNQVPTYKPDASFAFMKAWIQNDDYPQFNKDCKTPPSHTDSSSFGDDVVSVRVRDGVPKSVANL